jgi:hypothetical protein
MKRRAWIFIAEAAEIDMFISGALPESAFLDIIINSVALTAIAVRCPAGSAVKATRPVLGLFHYRILFLAVEVLIFASPRSK